jgi:hypothetical protein
MRGRAGQSPSISIFMIHRIRPLPRAHTLVAMDLYEPFTGVLLLPDRAPFDRVSAVTLGSGEPVAMIRWHAWTNRARFDLLEPGKQQILASGARHGIFGVRYAVTSPRGDDLLRLSLGFWGVDGRCTVTHPGGPPLTTRGNWSKRQFSVVDDGGRPVAQIVNTSRLFTLRPDSFAFELQAPVLSAVQAIGLAQSLRAAVESARAVYVSG